MSAIAPPAGQTAPQDAPGAPQSGAPDVPTTPEAPVTPTALSGLVTHSYDDHLTGTEITRFGLIVGTDTETIPGQNGATDTQVVTYQVAWFTEVSPSVPGDALTEVEPPESTG